VHVVEASSQEADATQESAATLFKEVEDRATLARREAREKVSRMEVVSAAALASARGDAEVLVRWISLLKGELTEACQARDTTEVNSRGLSDVAVTPSDSGRSLRGSARNGSRSLPFCKHGVAVSSAVQCMLGRSPTEALWVDVMGE
jgi:hypothetical protein